MHLHVIIPALNEVDNLRQLVPLLRRELAGRGSITVADGGSQDETATLLAGYPDVRHLRCQRRGRAQQMNEGACNPDSPADALYFVHADTRPPGGFYQDILQSIQAGYAVGCYRFTFDRFHPLLLINAFCTRFNGLACRGGDQSLYLTTEAFTALGGFRDMVIMEDYDIIQRVWESEFDFRVIPRRITVSARKYRVNGWLRVQLANLKVFRMYRRGVPGEELLRTYREMLEPW